MIKKIIALFLIFVFSKNYAQSDTATLKEMNLKWIKSYSTKDTSTVSQILADDFVMISSKGIKMSKMDVLNNISSNGVKTFAIVDSTTVRIFGEAAYLIAYTHFAMQMGDQPMQGKNCYSDLYLKRNGKWMAVASHVTTLAMN